MKQHNLSLTLFTVRSSPLPYVEKLKKVREIGYQSIQSGLVEGMTPQEHKKLLDSMGIEVSAFGGGFRFMDNPGPLLEGCHVFDVDEVMVGALPVEDRGDYDGYMRSVELLNKAGRMLRKEGVYISFHNHAQDFKKFSNGKTGMDLLVNETDPDAVHFILDTHWLQAGGVDILVWMDKLKERMQYLHVKDYRIQPANYEYVIEDYDKEFAQIGGGNLPWPEIVKKGLENGIKAFIVEQDNTYNEDCFDCAAQSFNCLKSLGLK